MFERIVRTVFVVTVATVAIAAGSSGVLSPGPAHPAVGRGGTSTAASHASELASIVAKATTVSGATTTDAPGVQVAAPRRPASAQHNVSTAAVKAPARPAPKPVAHPAVATISVWTSGFQSQLNACRGAVDLTGAYRVPTIGEKWTCGGARFPRAGSLVRLTGLHAGLYRVGRVVAMLNAYTQNSGAIPRGYQLLFQTCINDNAHTEAFTSLTRVG
jgi:hypothetical protein